MQRLLLVSGLLCLLNACHQQSDSHQAGHELKFEVMEQKSDYYTGLEWQQALPYYSQGYYPSADPTADLKAAGQLAIDGDKKIFMVVGGDWCSWCHVMTRFFTEHRMVRELLLSRYVLLKVNMSEENENLLFLSEYPEIKGYPHIFILSGSGELISSVNTAKLESGRTYSVEKFTELLSQY